MIGVYSLLQPSENDKVFISTYICVNTKNLLCKTLQSVNGPKGHTVTDDHQNFASEMHQFPSDTNQQEYTRERDQPRLECVNAPIYENKYNDIG